MSPVDPIVVIGAGQAGAQMVDSLRHAGYQGPLILIGAESYPPYHRPPLSKAWMINPTSVDNILIRSQEALQKQAIEVRLNCSVKRLDVKNKTIFFADGTSLKYAKLGLATGSFPRPIPVPGADLKSVHYLRDMDDSRAIGEDIRQCIQHGKAVAVIGGGFIGLEVAASARKMGAEVVVIEGLPRLMSRVAAPIVSDAFDRIHRSHGLQLIYDAQVEALLEQNGKVCAVRTADGKEYSAGCVVVGIGTVADDRLAAEAGLNCERGVVVDGCSRTSDPNVFAAGDCAVRHMPNGEMRRLESVNNAFEQAKAAAAAMLGEEKPFDAAPWFWSDQYDIKLQMVGISQGFDQVVTRGDIENSNFSAFYFREGQLIAVDSINRSGDHIAARRMLDKNILPTPDQVADETFELKSLLKRP
jgi:3-phenylpropionate/trans-cinnamate dioxygenase ferredoxin reductase subunit